MRISPIGRIAVTLGLAGGFGAVLAQRRHLSAIANDPANDRLSSPPGGTPLTTTSADGTVLYAEEFGPDGELTFVLAHGWTEQLAYWTLVIERLVAEGHRVVAYDLRGHGHSEPARDGDYSVERFGEDVEAVLAAACPDRDATIVVGHSLGAMSVVAWAEHHDVNARAIGAALLNTGVGSLLIESALVPVPRLAALLNRSPLASGLLAAPGGVPKISTPVSSALVRYTAFGPTATPAQVAFYERMLVACPPDVRVGCGLALSSLELHHAVPRLTVPTLVMAGADDRLTPPVHAERIASELPLPHALIVLPRTGHMGPIERPGEVSEALLDLARVASAQPAHQPA